jgi:hypothetical protein
MEENTKDFSDSEKLNLILAELADMKAWRVKVDAFIEDRSRDTQPMLGKIHKEIADTRHEMRETFEQVKTELNSVSQDSKKIARLVRAQSTVLFEAKAEWDEHGDRLHKLEEQMEKQDAA